MIAELKQQLQVRESELAELRIRNAALTKTDVGQREKLVVGFHLMTFSLEEIILLLSYMILLIIFVAVKC